VRKRPLGKTGRVVSELALGTWGLSGDGYGYLPVEEMRKTVAHALELGITLFETSDAYLAGGAEVVLGDALADSKGDHATVVTKIGVDRRTEPARRDYSRSYLRGAAERSLKRLRKERHDVLLLAHPSEVDLGRSWEITEALSALKKDGLCKHWGVACGSADVAMLAVEQGAEVIELPYNLLHVTDMNRAAGDVLIGQCGLLARSVLSYGLLGHEDWTRETSFGKDDHRRLRWTPEELCERLRQRDEMRFLVRDGVPTLRGAAVRFVLENPLVSSAVLGPRSVAQLRELLRETGVGPTYLPHEDLRRVYRVLERAGVFP
jgi:aryl-alcohol dehydrogenase-like predicted oxidoreductase